MTKQLEPFPESFEFNANGQTGIIQKVTEKEVADNHYSAIGSSFGVCVQYCAWLGSKYCNDFMKKVKYYVPVYFIASENKEVKLLTNQSTMAVVKFYGDKIKL